MTAQQPDGPQEGPECLPATGADATGTEGRGEPQETDAGRDDQEMSPNREAARYRTKLREVEAERDALVARVERHQQAEVNRLVDGRLAQPDDLLAYGVTLDTLLDDQGEVDAALVDTALLGLLEARPGLAAARPRTFPDLGGGRRGTSTDAGPAKWSEIIGQERVRG